MKDSLEYRLGNLLYKCLPAQPERHVWAAMLRAMKLAYNAGRRDGRKSA